MQLEDSPAIWYSRSYRACPTRNVGHTGIVLFFRYLPSLTSVADMSTFSTSAIRLQCPSQATRKWGTQTTCEKFGLSDVPRIAEELWHSRGGITAHLGRIREKILSLPELLALIAIILPADAGKVMGALWKALSWTYSSFLDHPCPNNSDAMEWQLPYKTKEFWWSYELKIITYQ